MSLGIPICIDHDHERIIGHLRGNVVRFKPGTVTKRNMLLPRWKMGRCTYWRRV